MAIRVSSVTSGSSPPASTSNDTSGTCRPRQAMRPTSPSFFCTPPGSSSTGCHEISSATAVLGTSRLRSTMDRISAVRACGREDSVCSMVASSDMDVLRLTGRGRLRKAQGVGMVQHGTRQLAGRTAVAAEAGLAHAVRHARAGAALAVLHPDFHALARHMGTGAAAVLAHAAKYDRAAAAAKFRSQIQHHLFNGRRIAAAPGALHALHAPATGKVQFLVDRHHHYFARAYEVIMPGQPYRPAAMPPDRTGQLLFKAAVKMLGV